MRCYVCDAMDWHSLPKEVNFQKRDMVACKNCGNLAYKIEPEEEKELRDFYRADYRSAPSVVNLITTTHKLNYIKIFLADWLKEKKGLTVGDVGCATGYLVNWFRQLGHRATGSEWAISYRRFAEHFYGIPVSEELEPKYKYDLITMYHTLEHFVEPDKKIERYLSMLKDDGHLFVSVPVWLDEMQEHGGGEWRGYEHYFHLNHINIFTDTSLQNLFRKFGLKVVKRDTVQYGHTYLLQKQVNPEKQEIVKEDYKAIEAQVFKIKQASDLYAKKDFKGAVAVWPKFPDAYSTMIFGTYMKELDTQADLFEEAFEKAGLKENTKMRLTYAVWLYQQQRYEEALKEFEWLINVKPSEDMLMYAGWCLSNMGHHDKAKEPYFRAATMNPQKWTEAMNWICREAVQMPTWDERAAAEIKEKLFHQAAPQIQLSDPNMEEK